MKANHANDLENRLFLMACVISSLVAFLLFFIDTFVAKSYASSVVEVISLIVFITFYYQVRYKKRFQQLVNPFIISLIIIINAAWFTGGGLNMTNVFIFFLILILIMILSSNEKRAFYVVIIFINLALFTSLEFLYPDYSMPVLKDNKLLVINSIALVIIFSITAYVLIFFKNHYDQEREIVKEQNLKLDASYNEIESQNEELIQYQEEVMAQRDFIEDKNKILEKQAIELEKANQKVQDINSSLEKTVEERTKKLSDLNNDLDLLVYRSSHDFRRPLTTLMGLNEIARLTVKDELSKELFDKVNLTALNMDKMLLKFFMLYNINHFRTTYEGDSLEHIVERLELNLISRKKSISFLKEIQLDAYADRDERNSLIEIILENLLENALIYNSKEKLFLELAIKEKDGYLHITLKDNGNGIPFSIHEKIFEMYFRGSTLSTGNGLGLYVVKRAALILNAEINLNSEEGVFTRFHISFNI